MNKSIKIIIYYNLIALSFFSVYLLGFWQETASPYFNYFFFLELAITIVSTIFYFYLRSSIGSDWFKDKLFFALLFLFVYGAGIHLSANQIQEFANSSVIIFYDETISHIMTHSAILGLAILLSVRQLSHPIKDHTTKIFVYLLAFSAVIQGFISATFTLEGGSAALTLPISVGMLFFLLTKINRKNWKSYPVSSFYLAYFFVVIVSVTLIYFVNNGFVESSSIGFGVF